ncbi:MAG TPA: hypothetical protein VNG32_04225 [Candidatus Dormibacteraeota bacterium]|nr:hypothetical protein [Candidatus Dormibacteraeota bacterium]
MFEFSSVWELDPSGLSFPISDRAMHGFSMDENITNDDDDSRRTQLKAELARDPVLAKAVDDLIDGWGLGEDVKGYFVDGFTFGHRLLSIEEEIGGSSIPITSAATIEMFKTALQLNWHDSADYSRDRFGDVIAQNGKYMEALAEAFPNESTICPTQASVYALGVLNLHDILLQQKCADRVIETYLGRLNETNIAP